MNSTITTPDVLTLSEAARFLRVKKALLLQLAEKGQTPARKIGSDWRFLRCALEDWLRGRTETQNSLLQQAGLFKNDPDLPQILEDVYRARGRPEREDG